MGKFPDKSAVMQQFAEALATGKAVITAINDSKNIDGAKNLQVCQMIDRPDEFDAGAVIGSLWEGANISNNNLRMAYVPVNGAKAEQATVGMTMEDLLGFECCIIINETTSPRNVETDIDNYVRRPKSERRGETEDWAKVEAATMNPIYRYPQVVKGVYRPEGDKMIKGVTYIPNSQVAKITADAATEEVEAANP